MGLGLLPRLITVFGARWQHCFYKLRQGLWCFVSACRPQKILSCRRGGAAQCPSIEVLWLQHGRPLHVLQRASRNVCFIALQGPLG